MTQGRSPSARVSDCHEELSEKGYKTKVNRTHDYVFYILPEKSAEATGEDKQYLRQLAYQIAVEEHNLHLFNHEGKWAVTSMAQEIAEPHLF